MRLTSVEVCAGAGGQAIGLEAAGFDHLACVEIDPAACETLRLNRPKWNVYETDLREWKPAPDLRHVDLLAGGVPCPPFSIAGQRRGKDDERDLFPAMIDLAEELRPRAVMIENVRGLLAKKFESYRAEIVQRLEALGYQVCGWELLDSADFGVPQTRPRAILVAMQPDAAANFSWPEPSPKRITVGEALRDEMASGGWAGADEWAAKADDVAPALVGGSKKHGGADVGPTRAKRSWRELGVDGISLADAPPGPGYKGLPKITVRMAAKVQGFPDDWQITGRKTAAYRQVGNAFPPPVAEAVGLRIASALAAGEAEEAA